MKLLVSAPLVTSLVLHTKACFPPPCRFLLLRVFLYRVNANSKLLHSISPKSSQQSHQSLSSARSISCFMRGITAFRKTSIIPKHGIVRCFRLMYVVPTISTTLDPYGADVARSWASGILQDLKQAISGSTMKKQPVFKPIPKL